MGSTWSLDESDSYSEIRMWASLRIDQDREAGGDRRAIAPTLERHLAAHVTETGEKGDPCVVCGETWPCGAIRYILSPE